MPATSAAIKPPSHGAHAFSTDDVEYLNYSGSPLLLRLFKPTGAGPFPLMIDLHGGAWCNQDRTSDVMFNEALASSGVVVAALDFRMPPVANYPASLTDINYAIRWLKARAGALKARADRFGIIGISSGGHLGMLAAMRPRDTRSPRYSSQTTPKSTPRSLLSCWCGRLSTHCAASIMRNACRRRVASTPSRSIA